MKRLDYADMVIDYESGLIWEDSTRAVTQINDTFDAPQICQNLNLGGNTNWRVPTITELKTILDEKRKKPAIKRVFKNCANGNYLTSREVMKNSSSSWVIDFNYGTEGFSPANAPIYLRCVKN